MNHKSAPGERLKLFQGLNRDRTIAKLNEAMNAITREMEKAGGYPHNKGRLNRKELCRRAGIGESTLKNKTHAETAQHVKDWLEKLNANSRVGEHGEKADAVTARDIYQDLRSLSQGMNILKIQNEDLRIRVEHLEQEKREMITVIQQLRKENSP